MSHPDGIQAMRGKRILVVDDNETNRFVLRELLGSWGCLSGEAADGPQALEELRKGRQEGNPYQIALLDMQMPGMNGFEATRAIRDRGSKVQRCDIPIIAMTAHAMKGDRERCLVAGMNDYISKPVTTAALQEVIEKYQPAQESETVQLSRIREISDGDLEFERQWIEEFLADAEQRLWALEAAIEETGQGAIEVRSAHPEGCGCQFGGLGDAANRVTTRADRQERKAGSGSGHTLRPEG